ncbi:hypothetical protein DFJ58DRAFT_735609 [Suillus subalutaceus]|uniref:uncharacterized protein n=1 Tax=Suillus subalutaceus TaxID=48586 RepID=UPI001B867C3C|nr:uncharacterized protein DFJ58DRAFT_735609 [Suillus subalutaceus]KAG1835328.1 hypothetical protein DFJ58DRAFT_735609 [Suillus subalutaceus]
MTAKLISSSTFHQDVAIWTSHGPAGESGASPGLDHGFASSEFSSDETTVGSIERNPGSGPGTGNENDDGCSPAESSHVIDDGRSLAERRPRRLDRRLPVRFRDILPQPPPPPMAEVADPLPTSDASTLLSRRLHFFRTFPNVFGLLCQYYSNRLPTHNPEEVITLKNLTLTHLDLECLDLSMPTPIMQHDSLEAPDTFYPYPNKSSFLLGDWYWNGGIQKSQKSFMELLRIIGDPEFQPKDICTMRWNFINCQLGSTVEDAEGRTLFEGAGWKKNPIKITIPVHNRADGSGIHDYLTTEFYH